MCRFACLGFISGLTLASLSLWIQVVVSLFWAHSESSSSPMLLSSACAMSAAALLAITFGGLHVAVRMCSLASAAILLLVFIATRCDDIVSWQEIEMGGGGTAGNSSAVECTIVMAEGYHSWIQRTYGKGVSGGSLLSSIIRGPGDALYLVAAIRHISSTWRNVVASIRESIGLLRRLKDVFHHDPPAHRLLESF